MSFAPGPLYAACRLYWDAGIIWTGTLTQAPGIDSPDLPLETFGYYPELYLRVRPPWQRNPPPQLTSVWQSVVVGDLAEAVPEFLKRRLVVRLEEPARPRLRLDQVAALFAAAAVDPFPDELQGIRRRLVRLEEAARRLVPRDATAALTFTPAADPFPDELLARRILGWTRNPIPSISTSWQAVVVGDLADAVPEFLGYRRVVVRLVEPIRRPIPLSPLAALLFTPAAPDPFPDELFRRRVTVAPDLRVAVLPPTVRSIVLPIESPDLFPDELEYRRVVVRLVEPVRRPIPLSSLAALLFVPPPPDPFPDELLFRRVVVRLRESIRRPIPLDPLAALTFVPPAADPFPVELFARLAKALRPGPADTGPARSGTFPIVGAADDLPDALYGLPRRLARPVEPSRVIRLVPWVALQPPVVVADPPPLAARARRFEPQPVAIRRQPNRLAELLAIAAVPAVGVHFDGWTLGQAKTTDAALVAAGVDASAAGQARVDGVGVSQ